MIETVRCGLAERGLERGCRFMITANFLDDMRIDLLFNRLGRNAERILDRERGARTVRDDADAVHAEQAACRRIPRSSLSFWMARNAFCAR